MDKTCRECENFISTSSPSYGRCILSGKYTTPCYFCDEGEIMDNKITEGMNKTCDDKERTETMNNDVCETMKESLGIVSPSKDFLFGNPLTVILPDSGARQEFESGAVRDISEGKGRCDLLPLDLLSDYYSSKGKDDLAVILDSIHSFTLEKSSMYLWSALHSFVSLVSGRKSILMSLTETFLDVSKHYEAGAIKYSPNNWKKGIPLHCFIDSGVRHLLKYWICLDDEPHDRAFVWNMLGAMWTLKHHPELDDLEGY